MSQPIIIAIDGPSASGKGTVAKRLAAHFDFALLDTGLLYRAVAYLMMHGGLDLDDAKLAQEIAANTEQIFKVLPNAAALRQDVVSNAASKVASYPGVRAELLNLQVDFAHNPPNRKSGAVLDGRDIGTVIVPDAKVKIYVTASSEVRAERRFKELKNNGAETDLAAVLKDMQERDARDASRLASPAKPADDAVILDTTHMNAEQAFAEAMRIAESRLK